MAHEDVFYFGNAIGESGDNPANAIVDSQDELRSRTNKTGFSSAAIDNHFDYNRDAKVNAADDLVARHNAGGAPLLLIITPNNSPFAADAGLQPLSIPEESPLAPLAAESALAPLAVESTIMVSSSSVVAIPSEATSALDVDRIASNPSSSMFTEMIKRLSVLPEEKLLPQITPSRRLASEDFITSSQPSANTQRHLRTQIQDRLHDAIFERLQTRRSWQSSAQEQKIEISPEIETILAQCQEAKINKHIEHAVDIILSTHRHREMQDFQ